MPLTASASVLEILLALLRRSAVPVLRVHVVGDGAVAERGDRRHEVPTSVEVRRPDVGWLDADEVGQGLLKTLHFVGDGAGVGGA